MLSDEAKQKLSQVVASQRYPLVFATVSGSHLYGFPSVDSDFDLRGVHLLPLEEVIGLRTGAETIEVSEVQSGLELDLVTHDLKKFMELMLRRNGYVLEQLLSPLVIHTSPIHQALIDLAPDCITKHHSHHYLGFAQTQWRLFSKEEAPRVKPLLYVYRVLLTGIHLMQTGKLEANLAVLNDHFQLSYVPDLMAQKLAGAEKAVLSTADLAFHEGEFARLVAMLKDARDASDLVEEPTVNARMHDLLVQVRSGAFPCVHTADKPEGIP